jgi:DNA-binding NtrC family response regulator
MSPNPFPPAPVLLVDDEVQALAAADFTLRSEGITNVVTCADSRQVMDRLAAAEHAAVLLDLTMPGLSGRELLPRIVAEHPEVPVIVLTAVAELDTAVGCMRDGAFDYLVKPVEEARLVSAVRHAIEMRQARGENERLARALFAEGLEHPEAFAAIVTRSPGMLAVFRYLEAIAATPLPVLITGETGTGKELVARALHALSGRRGAFVAVNVAGLDDTLASDALFGHKRGGFTGADRDRAGLIEQAAGGTLFLDEIGDLAAQSQIKLLRLLQDGRYYPIGSDLQKASDARIVVATNKDLVAMQAKGEFRRDLFYRLRAHHVHLPPLRRRREDLPVLVEHFIAKAAGLLRKAPPTPPRELVPLLEAYSFPGNIRELEGLIADAVSRHRSGVLSLEPFREKLGPGVPEAAGAGDAPPVGGGQPAAVPLGPTGVVRRRPADAGRGRAGPDRRGAAAIEGQPDHRGPAARPEPPRAEQPAASGGRRGIAAGDRAARLSLSLYCRSWRTHRRRPWSFPAGAARAHSRWG